MSEYTYTATTIPREMVCVANVVVNLNQIAFVTSDDFQPGTPYVEMHNGNRHVVSVEVARKLMALLVPPLEPCEATPIMGTTPIFSERIKT